jgi:hypothetical protein
MRNEQDGDLKKTESLPDNGWTFEAEEYYLLLLESSSTASLGGPLQDSWILYCQLQLQVADWWGRGG